MKCKKKTNLTQQLLKIKPLLNKDTFYRVTDFNYRNAKTNSYISSLIFNRNKNKISNKNTFSDDCRVSIQTTWTNEKESKLRQNSYAGILILRGLNDNK